MNGDKFSAGSYCLKFALLMTVSGVWTRVYPTLTVFAASCNPNQPQPRILFALTALQSSHVTVIRKRRLYLQQRSSS
ncbi:hypothetical protein FB446DRAFT_482961 [Lentinula raphanica]|nr:hypothetical protein FB446DRAFT_482961 [Lentinula raphanica]